MAVAPIPEGYHTVTPYLMVKGVAGVLSFLERAFDAKVTHCMKKPDGTVGHADVVVGNSHIMMGEACGDWAPMPSAVYLYVPDVDASYRRAIEAGATAIMEPANQFYGDRHGGVKDAAGNLWWIATHIEDVSPEELSRRAAEAHQKKS
jgi:PhnB protein